MRRFLASSSGIPVCVAGGIPVSRRLAISGARSALVSRADEFKQNTGLCLILGDVSKVIEDQEIEAIEAIDGRFERKLASRDLEFLYEIGGPGEEHLRAVLERNVGDGDQGVVDVKGGFAPSEIVGSAEEDHPVIERTAGGCLFVWCVSVSWVLNHVENGR